MAKFTNYATLSYNGAATNSNTVTGEILEILSATKTAVKKDYTAKDDVTYVISLINSGTTAVNGLTIVDDLGGYAFEEGIVYPLTYVTGSLRYYINGVLQPTPTVVEGPPMSIMDVSVPAGGNAIFIYETMVTNFAPLAADAEITNTATITGGGISVLTAKETIKPENRAELSISKAICPNTIAENGQLSYTFVIENIGNTPTSEGDNVILTDTFRPILELLSVTFNGTAWSADGQYSYDAETGVFTTLPDQITVPAASYTQNTDGTWTITPGTATLVITGKVS